LDFHAVKNDDLIFCRPNWSWTYPKNNHCYVQP